MAIGKDIISGTVPSDKSVRLFENIIAQAYQKVLSGFDGADMANKARRAAILRQLDQIVADTHMDMQAWAITQIPAFYEAGAFAAAKDMVKGGQAVDMYKNFATIHQEAIASLINETSADIASAMAGFSKMGQNLVNTATRDALLSQVAVGKITGDSRKAISKGIIAELKQKGISAMTDKSGRTWDLATYGSMLARTKLTQAHNSGVMMRLAAEGNDLVIVSSHMSACRLCAPWEHKTLSVSGRSTEYPSLDEAKGSGLFHPNCRHAISPIPNDTEYLNNSKVWDANNQQYVNFTDLNKDQAAVLKSQGKVLPKTKANPFGSKKAELNTEFAKIGGKELPLTDFHAGFMQDHNVGFVVNNKTRAMRTQGHYTPSTGNIMLNRSAIVASKRDGAHTFFHELGHAIDYKGGVGGQQITNSMMWRNIPSEEKLAVAKARFVASYARTIEKYNMTPQEVELAWNGMSVTRDITVMRNGIERTGKAQLGSGSKHLRYLRSNVEVFGDGYAQHTLAPKEFKKIAPSIADFFNNIQNQYGK